jgi:hypothetical protein
MTGGPFQTSRAGKEVLHSFKSSVLLESPAVIPKRFARCLMGRADASWAEPAVSIFNVIKPGGFFWSFEAQCGSFLLKLKTTECAGIPNALWQCVHSIVMHKMFLKLSLVHT